MAKRSRSDNVVGGLLGVLLVVATFWGTASEGEWGLFSLLLFGLFVIFWGWLFFFKATTCDVQKVTDGMPCSNNADGLLRACRLRRHKQIKRWAILAHVTPAAWWSRIRRPRRVWSDVSAPLPADPAPPPAPANLSRDEDGTGTLCRNNYEWITLLCTVTSTLSGILGLVLE